ncbi:MAG: hypothetical protein A2511_14080 [Deltaproteobacteria bacterium RIFOXYD12_FULL_50_9]|nr:MAG: hypothetical protein A2511_14080 [Deltaproteobacteria bacterium RIFOXYD12_FULL_50_9]
MSNNISEKFGNVTVTCKANIYFSGRVVSHSITFSDNRRKTIGLIYAGLYKFDTGAPERMDIIAGECRVRISGQVEWTNYSAGEWFDVPGHSFFEIEVPAGITEYICSFD